MNAFPLTRHLLLKDLRHQRTWLALLWLVALLLPLMAPIVLANEDTGSAVIMLTAGGLFLLIFLALARVIRLDPPGRGLHFLATRPVPRMPLLAGKALFIGPFLLVPFWIVKLGVIFMMKIPVNFTDVVLILTESTLCVGALIAVVALFSLFLRNLPVIFASLIGGAVLLMFGLTYFLRASYAALDSGPVDYSLSSSKLLVFYLGIIVTVAAVALVRYRRKSIRKPAVVLVAGLALSGLALAYWPFDLSRSFSSRPQMAGELKSPLREQIKAALSGTENPGGFGENGVNGVRYFNVSHAVSLEGMQFPYYATMAGYHSEATLKSGRVIPAEYEGGTFNMQMEGEMRRGGIFQELEERLAGLPPRQAGGRYPYSFEIFNYKPDDFQKEDLTGATLKGELTLEIRRVYVVKTMPFKSGATVNMPRQRYTVQGVEFKPGNAGCKMLTVGVSSMLRGDTKWPGMENFSWLVFNRSKGECLSDGGGSGGSTDVFCTVSTLRHSLGRVAMGGDWKKAQEPIPEDWADDAEIAFFSTEPCGSITVPYEIKNFDLKH